MATLNCFQGETYPLSHLKDEQVKSILEKAFQRTGGLSVWKEISRLEFEKHTTLYDNTGEVESQTLQQHRYFFKPRRVLEIQWQDSIGTHKIIQNNNILTKYLNGENSEQSDLNVYSNMIASAEFVISLPFKLADKSYQLSYQGIDTLPHGEAVHVIQAKYQPLHVSKFDTSDVWWHYFSPNDFRHTAYKVQHLDHISYVQNLEFSLSSDIFFPKRRKSFRLNTDGTIEYVRANYIYSNFIVE